MRTKQPGTRKLIAFFLTTISISGFLSTTSASGEQSYKVRVGEIGNTEYFQVGFKSFNYTDRGYNSYYGANLFLAPCAKADDSDCIESLSFKINNSDAWYKAELDTSWTIPTQGVPLIGSAKGSTTEFVIKNRVATAADPENNYPAGGATSIWKVAQAGRAPNFRLLFNFNLRGSNPDPKSEKINWYEFVTQVIPMSMSDGINYYGTPNGTIEKTFGNISAIKARVRVKILKQILNGWVHSRIMNPEITYGIDSGSREFVDFSGSPLEVPTAEAVLSASQYLAVYENPYMKTRLGGLPAALPDSKVLWNQWSSTDGIDQGDLKMWSAYEPYFSKEAVSLTPLWKISGEGNLNLQKFSSSECISNGKIDGILATNATQYSPTPPTFVESTQELSYQLAAPHFKSTNEEFKGTYSLVISEKLARCIWGNSLTNASARVTILSQDGKSSVTTQTLKLLSGYYYFNISGFGFSAPTIRIKLSEESIPIIQNPPKTVSSSNAKNDVSVKKSTIICVKGKVSQKVTGSNPKCPSGYKVK